MACINKLFGGESVFSRPHSTNGLVIVDLNWKPCVERVPTAYTQHQDVFFLLATTAEKDVSLQTTLSS